MSNPVSVVLLGAPGSKKSAVATEFERLVTEDRARNGTLDRFTIIDDIPKSIEEDYGMAVGIHGAYLVNWLIAMRRFDAETALAQEGRSYISVGSLVETIAHGARNIELMSVIQTDEMQDRLVREMHATTALTFMFIDTFKYSYGFYIPLSQVVLPSGSSNGNDADQDTYNRAIDANIVKAFEKFGFTLPTLTGSVEVMAESMLEQIKALEAKRDDAVLLGEETE